MNPIADALAEAGYVSAQKYIHFTGVEPSASQMTTYFLDALRALVGDGLLRFGPDGPEIIDARQVGWGWDYCAPVIDSVVWELPDDPDELPLFVLSPRTQETQQ